MKLTYLIIITMFLESCNTFLKYPIKIIAVQDYSQDNICIYTTNQINTLGTGNLKFISKCGIYNVGDTLKITKQ